MLHSVYPFISLNYSNFISVYFYSLSRYVRRVELRDVYSMCQPTKVEEYSISMLNSSQYASDSTSETSGTYPSCQV